MATPALSWGQADSQGLGSGYPYKEKALEESLWEAIQVGQEAYYICKSRTCLGNVSPLPAGVWEEDMGQVVSVEGTVSRS